MAALSSFRFGVSRSHGGLRLADGAQRFAACLGDALGCTVRLQVAYDYEGLLDGLLDGAIDLAWMPPLVHARAIARGALLTAVAERGGALSYRGALLVHQASAYQRVTDLRASRAAWVDPGSASGYVFPRLYLRSCGIDPKRDFASEKFYGASRLACAAVASDEADLCTSFVSEAAAHDRAAALVEVRRAVGPVGERLRLLDVTDSIPPDGFVLAPGLGAHVQADARDALLGLHHRPDGPDALRTLLQADRLLPVTSSVQRMVARLPLEMALR